MIGMLNVRFWKRLNIRVGYNTILLFRTIKYCSTVHRKTYRYLLNIPKNVCFWYTEGMYVNFHNFFSYILIPHLEIKIILFELKVQLQFLLLPNHKTLVCVPTSICWNSKKKEKIEATQIVNIRSKIVTNILNSTSSKRVINFRFHFQ